MCICVFACVYLCVCEILTERFVWVWGGVVGGVCVLVCVRVCAREKVKVFCVLRACGCLTNAYVRMSMRLTFCACRRFGLTKRKQHFSDHRKIWQACPEY